MLCKVESIIQIIIIAHDCAVASDDWRKILWSCDWDGGLDV